MIDIETYALAKAYTDKAIEGGGAIQGKNCVITEIEDVGNTHIVHFQWTLDDGTVETDTMTVEDGDLVEASETNGNIKINGVETQVYNDVEIKADIDAIDDIISTDEVTKEGNPLNFTTLSAQTAKSTILSLEPIQDLHGYDKPWVGGAGKNLFDGVVELGTIGSNGENLSNDNRCRSKNHIAVLPNTTYIFSVNGTATNVNWVLYDNTKTKIDGGGGGTGFTTPNNCYYVRWFYDLTLYQQTNYQLEVGSSPTSFEPYENICPISGRTEIGILGCGKNLADWKLNTTDNALSMALKPNTYCISGKTEPSDGNWYFRASDSNGDYPFSANDMGLFGNWNKAASGWVYGGSSNKSQAFIIPNGCVNIEIGKLNADGTIDAQLELGSTKTDYEPYTKSTDLTISLGQTVYGGTLDVENGVLVVTNGKKKISDLDWAYNHDGEYNRFEATISDMRIEATRTMEMQSSCYECLWHSEPWSTVQNITGIIYNNYSGKAIIHDFRFSSKTDFTTQMADEQIVYPLATPITINLTPHTINLLKGVNNISVDDANATITLTYRDGSVATLGDLTSVVDSIDGKIDESKILTDTATGDKYILVVTNGVLSVEQVSN